MVRRQNQQLLSKLFIYYDERRSSSKNVGLYEHMFSEDVHLAIMPIGGHSHTNPDFSVSINPHSDEMERLLGEALPTRNGYREYSLAETVCSFVDECAMTMASYGVAFYEKVIGVRPETDAPLPFQFKWIHNPCIHKTFGFIWQFVPSHIWRQQTQMGELMLSENLPRRWSILTSRNVAVFQMPSALGGRAGFKRTLADLHHLGEAGTSQFVLEDMNSGGENRSGYDFAAHRLSQDEHLARVTKQWGWMGRNMLRERITSFYQFHRSLVFEKAKAILREHIISELNRHLADLGSRLGFDVQIVVSGLPSSSDCETAIDQLTAGKMQFKDVVEFMRKV